MERSLGLQGSTLNASLAAALSSTTAAVAVETSRAILTEQSLFAQATSLGASMAVTASANVAALNQETARAISVEQSLALNVTLEVARAINTERSLANQINASFAQLLNQSATITREISRATAVELSLAAGINVEISRAVLAETALNSLIAFAVSALNTTLNKTLACSNAGLVYAAATDTCVPALPAPSCPTAPPSTLSPFATFSTCSDAARNGGTSLLAGTVCNASCLPGYTGTMAAYVCNSSGAWTPVAMALQCAANPCGSPPIFPNGNASCGSNASGSVCTTVCNTGFVSTGSNFTCRLGQYQGSPACTPAPCPSNPVLSDPNAAATSCAGTASGGICTPQCAAGFALNGSLVCSLGLWTGSVACLPLPCTTAPAPISNGFAAACVGTASGATCQPPCNAGFYQAGTPLNCTRGQFSGAPLCLPNSCSSLPPAVSGGSVANCANLSVGSTCTPVCGFGAYPNGSFTCNALNTWTGNVACGCYATGSASFQATGAPQTFLIPCGTTQLTIETWGAAGGNATSSSLPTTFRGGAGAFVRATFPVGASATLQPGHSLTIIVGVVGAPTSCAGGGAGGGGGGTWVFHSVSGTHLQVAGGGGGAFNGNNGGPFAGVDGSPASSTTMSTAVVLSAIGLAPVNMPAVGFGGNGFPLVSSGGGSIFTAGSGGGTSGRGPPTYSGGGPGIFGYGGGGSTYVAGGCLANVGGGGGGGYTGGNGGNVGDSGGGGGSFTTGQSVTVLAGATLAGSGQVNIYW